MKEIFILYTFVGLMAFNLLASFLYLTGLNELKAQFRRAFRTPKQKPR